MPISAANITSVLQKRRAYGSLSLGSFELDARQSVGPEPTTLTARVTGDDGATQGTFVRDETSGRLVYQE